MQSMSAKLTPLLALMSVCLALVGCSPTLDDVERFSGPPNVKQLVHQVVERFWPELDDIDSKRTSMKQFEFGVDVERVLEQATRADAVIEHFLGLNYEHPHEDLASLQPERWLEYVQGETNERITELAKDLDADLESGAELQKKLSEYTQLLRSWPHKTDEEIKSDIEKMQN